MAIDLSKKDGDAGIEISSLIDMIFLLLIFFVVSSTFHKTSLDISAPEASSATVKTQDEAIRIYITKKGVIHLDDTPMTYNALRDYLEKTPLPKSTPVLIEPDKETNTQYLVKAMDVFVSNGFSSLSIVTGSEGS